MNEELNNNKIFEFDHKDYGKKFRKAIILGIIILSIMWALDHFFDFKTFSFQLIMGKNKISPAPGIFGMMCACIYLLLKKRNISLEIYPNSFTLRNDKITETIPFSKINAIKVYKNNKGEPVYFVIKVGIINYHIFSLKEMSRLLEWFEENKIINLNWNLSFHKKSLFEIKRWTFLSIWLSLIVFFVIYELDLTLFFAISSISLGLMSFITINRNINYLNAKISSYRWFCFVVGLLLILNTIF